MLYEKDGKDVRKGICKANKYVGTKEKGTGKLGESRQETGRKVRGNLMRPSARMN